MENKIRSSWNKGIKTSEETKMKIRLSKLGTHLSQEAKDKISRANKGHSTFSGKHHTQETKDKISKTKKGIASINIPMNCESCNKEFISHTITQKYCQDCRKLYHKITSLSRKIPLKPACEICGSTDGLQRHHWRYDKPLLVNTLCKTCHEIQHIKHFYKSKYAMEIAQ